ILNIQGRGWGEIRDKLKGEGCDTILIPIGSCERHGNPFTPLGLDGMVTLSVVERAARKADVLHTPLMPFGYAPHHIGRENEGTGTVSLTVETYRRVLMDIGRSLIFHGFNKLIFVSFHSFNVTNAEEVLFALRHRTGAFVAFYGGRETPEAEQILQCPPDQMAGDLEASLALALLEPEAAGRPEDYARTFTIHAPKWLGPAFSKRPGTGMAVGFQGEENIWMAMEDYEFVDPPAEGGERPSLASRAKGLRLLDALAEHLAAFVLEVKKLAITAVNRDFSDRVR
ncbi:MAG: creatininase family protein, partial [Candidatus Methylomirabilales bacterium]